MSQACRPTQGTVYMSSHQALIVVTLTMPQVAQAALPNVAVVVYDWKTFTLQVRPGHDGCLLLGAADTSDTTLLRWSYTIKWPVAEWQCRSLCGTSRKPWAQAGR
jgi:hypothetical protein